MNKVIWSLLYGSILLFSSTLLANPSIPRVKSPEDFPNYIIQLKEEALVRGFSPDLIDRTFDGIQYQPRVVLADQNQPEKRQTLSEYLAKVVTNKRLTDALLQQSEQTNLLKSVEQHYAVPTAYILALWGLESNFGRIQGKENIVSALATLAFDGRREVFFKDQLFTLLDLLQRNVISPLNLTGSWAGAMGQSQFMPSALAHYGVDEDGDGLIDIWSNTHDVMGSIANYLHTEGWNAQEGWGFPVTLSQNVADNLFGVNQGQQKSVKNWLELGVKPDVKLQAAQLQQSAWLIKVYDQPEQYFLVYNNFRVLMHWNRSYFFALSVVKFADLIQQQTSIN